MEAEAAKLREMTAASDAKQAAGAGDGNGDVSMGDEDKEAVDSRSVYVGNVSDSALHSKMILRLMLLFVIRRSTTRLRRRRFRVTLLRAVPSIASLSSSTSSPDPKGELWPLRVQRNPLIPPSCDRYAYVEFAEPSLVANAVLLNESLFRGRLLKVCPSTIDLLVSH